VRIALNLKGLAYAYRAVHLNRGGGEQFAPEFRALNPQALVPVLEHEGRRFTQSLAILEYLDELAPSPPLLPRASEERARVRALSLVVACDTHPLNNLRVLNYVTGTLAASAEAKLAWYRHWNALGLETLEAEIAHSPYAGSFCHGDAPTMADCCLVPQLYNARRFNCDLSGYPRLVEIERNCLALPAFSAALPERQPDSE
jgi:maleylacetoacetate isomerase/maleylpyruvate isomerase